MIAVRPVSTRAEFAAFIRLPRQIYRGMKGYVAPLDFERRELLDPKKSPFFQHGEAQYFLAYRDDKPVGRISAQHDRLAVETWGAPIGCFGCLDAINDAEVVQALVDAAADWLRQRGLQSMRGPFTLSINGETGVQVDGQEREAMVLMPWHPPYLADLAAQTGLEKARDVLSFTISLKDYKRPERLLAGTQRRLPAGLHLRPLDLKDFRRDANIIRLVYNDAWQHNWGFVPMTEGESDAFAKGFHRLLKPEFGLIAELEGKPVAVAVVLPNLFDVIKEFDGRLAPFNWLKFATRAFRRSSYQGCRVTLLGRVQELKSVGGLLALLMIDMLIARNQSFTGAVEMGWVLEDNRLLINLMNAIGIGEPSKRYRVFETSLER